MKSNNFRFFKSAPSNALNNGKTFESRILAISKLYEEQHLLRLRKVEAPTLTLGRKPSTRTIYLENPFLDFVGTWTAREGRAVFIECKSTSDKARRNLSLGKGGLSDNQIAALESWTRAGAVAFVLWECCGEVRLVTNWIIQKALQSEKRHIAWADAYPVEQGKGFIFYDFLLAMERIWG